MRGERLLSALMWRAVVKGSIILRQHVVLPRLLVDERPLEQVSSRATSASGKAAIPPTEDIVPIPDNAA